MARWQQPVRAGAPRRGADAVDDVRPAWSVPHRLGRHRRGHRQPPAPDLAVEPPRGRSRRCRRGRGSSEHDHRGPRPVLPPHRRDRRRWSAGGGRRVAPPHPRLGLGAHCERHHAVAGARPTRPRRRHRGLWAAAVLLAVRHRDDRRCVLGGRHRQPAGARLAGRPSRARPRRRRRARPGRPRVARREPRRPGGGELAAVAARGDSGGRHLVRRRRRQPSRARLAGRPHRGARTPTSSSASPASTRQSSSRTGRRARRAFRFPYAITSSPAGSLFIADTSNNRIAIVDDAAATFAAEPVGGSFDRVLGQRDTDANGENRWDRVEHDSLCWPYGLSYHRGRLAIADSGNNRVTVWGVES